MQHFTGARHPAWCWLQYKLPFHVNINDMSTEIQPQPFPGNENEGNDHLNSNHFQQPPVVSPVDHDSNVPYDISVDRILLCRTSNVPMNVLQHVTYNSENSMKNVLVFVRIDNALVFDRGRVLS